MYVNGGGPVSMDARAVSAFSWAMVDDRKQMEGRDKDHFVRDNVWFSGFSKIDFTHLVCVRSSPTQLRHSIRLLRLLPSENLDRKCRLSPCIARSACLVSIPMDDTPPRAYTISLCWRVHVLNIQYPRFHYWCHTTERLNELRNVHVTTWVLQMLIERRNCGVLARVRNEDMLETNAWYIFCEHRAHTRMPFSIA